MAKKNFQKKKIQDTENSGFGKYQEEVGGGGSPQAKDPHQRAPGVNSDYRKSNNDTMQPRTDDGKFTYKSVNGKPIDPKYGESRGKTVNPLLTGGKNGVKIEDVENDFYNKSGTYWNKYKDKWYQKGSEMVTNSDLKVRVAADAIWNVAKRRYDTVKGEFENESHTFDEVKKGRHGIEEQAAIQQAKKQGAEAGVIDRNTGGLKLKPGTVVQPPQPKPQPVPRAGSRGGVTPVIPNGQPGVQPTVNTQSVSDIANADYTPKYSDDDIAEARQVLAEQGGLSDDDLAKFDALSPKEKDEYIDEFFGAEEETTEETPAPQENADSEPAKEESAQPQPKEEESEAEKKIKAMGFSE